MVWEIIEKSDKVRKNGMILRSGVRENRQPSNATK